MLVWWRRRRRPTGRRRRRRIVPAVAAQAPGFRAVRLLTKHTTQALAGTGLHGRRVDNLFKKAPPESRAQLRHGVERDKSVRVLTFVVLSWKREHTQKVHDVVYERVLFVSCRARSYLASLELLPVPARPLRLIVLYGDMRSKHGVIVIVIVVVVVVVIVFPATQGCRECQGRLSRRCLWRLPRIRITSHLGCVRLCCG